MQLTAQLFLKHRNSISALGLPYCVNKAIKVLATGASLTKHKCGTMTFRLFPLGRTPYMPHQPKLKHIR